MQSANVNQVDLEYEVRGSGEPVLLISTGPIADSFLPLVSEEALVERYRLITYRQRRLDPSRNDRAPVSFATHAADAAALLDHLGVQCAHVAGHSTGAAIALQLALDHGDVVQTLTLLEPTLVGAQGAAAFFEKVGPAVAAYNSGGADRADGAMAEFLSIVCGLDWATWQTVIDARVPGGVARATRYANNWFCSYLPALSAWQFGPVQAAAIHQPVLSVLGAESDAWFVGGHELLRGWFPQLEDCNIEGAAHLLHIQRPEPVARGIAEFLARHPVAVGSATTAVGSPLSSLA